MFQHARNERANGTEVTPPASLCHRPSRPSASRSSPNEMAHRDKYVKEAITIEHVDRCGMWTVARGPCLLTSQEE